jgi:hypothetical protein
VIASVRVAERRRDPKEIRNYVHAPCTHTVLRIETCTQNDPAKPPGRQRAGEIGLPAACSAHGSRIHYVPGSVLLNPRAKSGAIAAPAAILRSGVFAQKRTRKRIDATISAG